jgi:hypothetical protein
MENKLQKIILVSVAVAILGWMFYQQMTLSAIKKMVMPAANVLGPAAGESGTDSLGKVALSDEVVAERKAYFIADTKDLVGTVTEVSGNTIKIEAEIVDLEKIKEATVDNVQTFAKTKKIFSVAVNDQTEFLSAKLGDIKPGGQIKILSNDLVYKTDKITATKINFPYSANPVSGEKFVSGKVKEKGSDTWTISAVSKEGKETGVVYSVKINKYTKFTRKDLASQPPKDTAISVGDIKSGDSVVALAPGPIGDRKEFEAIEILILVSPAK